MTKRELFERLAGCDDDAEIGVALFEESHIDGDNEARFRCAGVYAIDAVGEFHGGSKLCINHNRNWLSGPVEAIPSSIVKELNLL